MSWLYDIKDNINDYLDKKKVYSVKFYLILMMLKRINLNLKQHIIYILQDLKFKI